MGTATVLEWPLVGRARDLERALASLADPRVRVVQLVGDAGTGKSRLAAEVLAAAELDGYPVAAVTATASAATVPLSALGALLPSTPDDPQQLIEVAVARAREVGDGARIVVHVDDVDLLDAVSCAVLARLWQEGLVVVVATQRAGTRTPDVVAAEQRSGGCLRIDVAELPRTSVATLLHHVLRGPVSGSAEHALWTASGGNPLFLRELVTGAVTTGRLTETDGVWLLDGPLDVTGGLAGLIAERLGSLTGSERDLVELLALCQPLGADELAAQFPFEALERLEADGLITVAADRRRQQVNLAHPLYAQVVRDGLPRLRARRLLLDQVTRCEEHGARRREDALRVAVWRLDATGTADVDLLLRGARLARAAHDYTQVERLAAAALLLEPQTEAGVLLGEAVYEQGRFTEAAEILSTATEQLTEPTSLDAARLAVIHGIVLFFGLGRPQAALDRLERTADLFDDTQGEQRRIVDSQRALLLTQSGRSRDALELLPDRPPEAADIHAVYDRARSWALYRRGRPAEAVEVAVAAWERQTGPDAGEGFLHPAGDLMVAALASLELGEPARARELAAQGRDLAIVQGVGYQASWLAWTVAALDLVMGYVDDATQAFRELVATSAAGGFGAVEHLAALGLAECAGLSGDAAGARAWMERAEALPAPPAAFDLHRTTAQVWLAAAEGDTRAAAQMAVDAGHELARRGEWRSAAFLFDEAVMFGSEEAARELVGLAEDARGPVTEARVARAQALLSGRAADLLAAAEAFAAVDYVHSAATMAARAAQVLRADGDPRGAAAAEAKARAWADASPGLQIDGLGSVAGAALLTPREKEIATLAARGRTSKEVAADLVLSVRTVDNHLANVYAKLGIGGRADLADALGITEDADVPAQRQGRTA